MQSRTTCRRETLTRARQQGERGRHADRLLKRAAGDAGRTDAVGSWAVGAVDVVQRIVHRDRYLLGCGTLQDTFGLTPR